MRLLAIATLLLTNMTHARDVYVEVDEEGVPTFSDQKLAGGQKMQIREPLTYSDPIAKNKLVQPRVEKLSPENDSTAPHYSLLITEPANDSAIRNNAGNIELTVSIEPGLRKGDIAELMMDGMGLRYLTSSGPVYLNHLDRGTHVFSVRVRDYDGNVVTESPSTSITILRHSKLH